MNSYICSLAFECFNIALVNVMLLYVCTYNCVCTYVCTCMIGISLCSLGPFLFLLYVGNSVILLPTTGNVGSTVMMQPQPYILVNPGAEIPRSNPPPLISPSVYCGNPGSGYILLSPNQNSLLQVVSSAGVCAPHSGKTVFVHVSLTLVRYVC